MCRMCAALAYLLIDRVEYGWLLIMENLPKNEKTVFFMDYFIHQWTDNLKVPTEVCNVHGQQHRTNI